MCEIDLEIFFNGYRSKYKMQQEIRCYEGAVKLGKQMCVIYNVIKMRQMVHKFPICLHIFRGLSHTVSDS